MAEPLHIGSGEFGAGRGLLRFDGNVVIPASTWKGAFRNIAELLARSMVSVLSGVERLAVLCYAEGPGGVGYRWDERHIAKFTGGLDVENLRTEYNRTRKVFVENLRSQLQSFSASSLGSWGEELSMMVDIGYRLFPREGEDDRIVAGLKIKDEDVVSKLFEDYLACRCPIGSLLGNGVLSGKLRFMDTVLGSVGVEERPGVGIDRKSGRAQEDVLYFTEVVPAGTEARLMLVADNLSPGQTDSRLFAGVLEWLKELGLQIGGRKSVGLGLMELRDARFWVWELGKGKDVYGAVLADPFKQAGSLDINQAVSWLRGEL